MIHALLLELGMISNVDFHTILQVGFGLSAVLTQPKNWWLGTDYAGPHSLESPGPRDPTPAFKCNGLTSI